MGAIADDAAIEFSFVPDDELTGYTEDEAYAFLAGVGPETSTAKLPPITAAFWKPSDHPRGHGGLFIDKTGVGEVVDSFKNALRGEHAVGAVPGRDQPSATDKHVVHLTSAEREAVSTYQSGAFDYINGGLRATRGAAHKVQGAPNAETKFNGTPAVRRAIAGLDSATERSRTREPIVVHRGVVDPAKVFGSHWSDGDLTGLSWHEHGFSSTSPDEANARSYARSHGGVVLNVHVPKGVGAVTATADVGDEARHEVVLQRNLRYRVIRDHGVINGTRVLDVEVKPA